MTQSSMRTWVSIVLVAAAGCNQRQSSGGTEASEFGKAVETKPPNGRGQKPAFPGQTRAPAEHAAVTFEARTVVQGLEHPWSMAFLPDGPIVVTERPGRMRLIGADGTISAPIAGVPPVDAVGQGGLFDVVLDPTFPTSGRIYFTYAERRDGGNGTTLARARLVREAKSARLDHVEVIWRQQPAFESNAHFGGRIVFARDRPRAAPTASAGAPGAAQAESLFVTTGERFVPESRVLAQRLDNALGKVIRIRSDGSIPNDNPFVGRPDARPEVYSYGHRNIQAAAIHPETNKLWVIEHGARGGDEVNIIDPGKNYGWPIITYGIDYSGKPIGDGITARNAMEQPRYYWDPSIAPSGAAFYTGSRYPGWRGNLFVGALAGRHVARLVTAGDRIVGEERLLVDRARFRDVRVGPDGLLYVLTDEVNGELIRLDPVQPQRNTGR